MNKQNTEQLKILKLLLEVVEEALDNTYSDSISPMHELKYVLYKRVTQSKEGGE